MGDIYEKLGKLLSEKIEGEIQNTEDKTDNLQLKIENTSDENLPLTEEQLSILHSQMSLKNTPTAERIPAGNYTEDTPVKIVTGTADFS